MGGNALKSDGSVVAIVPETRLETTSIRPE
jgi:hypothetical protein